MQRPYGFEMSDDCRSCKLKKDDFFCHISGAALKEFDGIKSLSVYPHNSVLFLESEQPRGVFILCEGQVKLSMASREGKTLILQIAKPGEVLGLTATLGNVPYETSAETLRPSQIAFVRREDFLRFINHYPEVYRSVVKQVVLKYESACDQLRTVGLSSTPKRLARLLLDWSDGTGAAEKTAMRITMPLTHEEIGAFIGSSRETVTRTLGDFRDRHLITMRGVAVTIHNRKALEEMAVA